MTEALRTRVGRLLLVRASAGNSPSLTSVDCHVVSGRIRQSSHPTQFILTDGFLSKHGIPGDETQVVGDSVLSSNCYFLPIV